jgi:RNA polymerase sigma factor (sigma-70 family)
MLEIQIEKSDPGSDTGATVFAQAQAGCSKSLNEDMQRHERLVQFVVQRQWLFTLPYEEALQAGRWGLWRAIMGYDSEQETSFGSYAYKSIMRQVWAAVKMERRRKRREVPIGVLVVTCYQAGADPAWLREQQEIRESLLELVKRLPKRLRRVITTYYGLNGKEPQTLQTIGEELGICRERVRQLRNEALVWMSQPAHSQTLRSLLARHTQQQYELTDHLAQVWLKRRGGRNGCH